MSIRNDLRAKSSCKLSKSKAGEQTLLTLDGELNSANTATINKEFINSIFEQPAKLFICLKKLTQIDSTGLGMLISAKALAAIREVEMILLSPKEPISGLFSSTKLKTIFTILGDQESDVVRSELANN